MPLFFQATCCLLMSWDDRNQHTWPWVFSKRGVSSAGGDYQPLRLDGATQEWLRSGGVKRICTGHLWLGLKKMKQNRFFSVWNGVFFVCFGCFFFCVLGGFLMSLWCFCGVQQWIKPTFQTSGNGLSNPCHSVCPFTDWEVMGPESWLAKQRQKHMVKKRNNTQRTTPGSQNHQKTSQNTPNTQNTPPKTPKAPKTPPKKTFLDPQTGQMV